MDATKVCFHRVTLTLVCLIFVLNGDVLGQEKITFEDHIKPMFRTRCAACHNPDRHWLPDRSPVSHRAR